MWGILPLSLIAASVGVGGPMFPFKAPAEHSNAKIGPSVETLGPILGLFASVLTHIVLRSYPQSSAWLVSPQASSFITTRILNNINSNARFIPALRVEKQVA